MQRLLRSLWYNPRQSFLERVLWCFLLPWSFLYATIMRCRAICYTLGLFKAKHLSIPVISIGNLVVGGTGKTPVTAHIAQSLIASGKKVVVLSRGYGGRLGGGKPLVVSDGVTIFLTPEDAGDEPFLLAQMVPGLMVVIARDRYAAGLLALEQLKPDCCLLDDGYQHLALERNLDIVLLDARHPLGNGFCLPAGPLREPRSALVRASLLGFTRWTASGCDTLGEGATPKLHIQNRLLNYRALVTGVEVSIASLQKTRCCAAAGIADPNQFFQGLEDAGLQLVGAMELPDHAVYTRELLRSLDHYAVVTQAEYIIVTEKDAVKLQKHHTEILHKVVIASMGLVIAEELFLQQRLCEVVR